MVKCSFLCCWFFGAAYPFFFSHFRFQSSFLFFVPLPQDRHMTLEYFLMQFEIRNTNFRTHQMENAHDRESDNDDDDDDDDGESNNSSGFEMELTRDAIASSLMNSL
ncbi:uncharacterized protein [Gossypium hirsutum]|uniref:Uncharacterized protein isoform X2 n=1 Tax=Gossypium hirsutum TaxID=3635 RepID=A0A1U8J636_GOSHI|nr:uncharacterized protein LOC107904033 isoform X2 [Gossypium hirsutum]